MSDNFSSNQEPMRIPGIGRGRAKPINQTNLVESKTESNSNSQIELNSSTTEQNNSNNPTGRGRGSRSNRGGRKPNQNQQSTSETQANSSSERPNQNKQRGRGNSSSRNADENRWTPKIQQQHQQTNSESEQQHQNGQNQDYSQNQQQQKPQRNPRNRQRRANTEPQQQQQQQQQAQTEQSYQEQIDQQQGSERSNRRRGSDRMGRGTGRRMQNPNSTDNSSFRARSHSNKQTNTNNNHDKSEISKESSTTTNSDLEYLKQLRDSMERMKLHASAAGEDCIICTEPIIFNTLGSCNHPGVCSFCAMRQRLLFKNYDCPVCKQKSQNLIFTNDTDISFNDIDLRTLYNDTASNVYFPEEAKEHFLYLISLRDIRCLVCHILFPNLNDLKNHLKQQHQVQMCSICLQHRPVFLQEQRLYSPSELTIHLRDGDPETNVKHEDCQFCQRSLYDITALYEHLEKEHEKCFLCVRDGISNQYYKSYGSLEQHFRKEHFLCENADCRAARFVVFRTEYDLKIHNLENHTDMNQMSLSERKRASQLLLNIERRNNEIESAVTMRNSSEKEEKSQKQEQSESNEEAFPALPTQTTLSSATVSSKWAKNKIVNQKNNQSQPNPSPTTTTTTTTTTQSSQTKKQSKSENSQQQQQQPSTSLLPPIQANTWAARTQLGGMETTASNQSKQTKQLKRDNSEFPELKTTIVPPTLTPAIPPSTRVVIRPQLHLNPLPKPKWGKSPRITSSTNSSKTKQSIVFLS